MRRVGILASVVAALLVPSLAYADDEVPPLPPPSGATTATASTTVDAVHLRNGGLYRGRVTEIVPGDHVTVLVAPGNETKRIPWPEVDRVIVASTAVPPAPTASTPAPTPAAPAPMIGPLARVHITAPKQVILYRRAPGTSSFVQACSSPCDLELPIGDTYRLAGNGLSQNKEFRLQAAPGGSVDIVVDPPSTGGMILGGFVAGTGATAAYVGLLMALVGQSEADRSCYSYTGSGYSSSCEQNKSDGQSVRNAGLVTMIVGAAVTALGIVVFINSASTDVSQKGGGGSKDAYVRTPTWRTAGSSAEGAMRAPTAAFPVLFTAHF